MIVIMNKKKMLLYIVFVIIGIIAGSAVTYAATMYSSDNVLYTTGAGDKTVTQSLDELYALSAQKININGMKVLYHKGASAPPNEYHYTYTLSQSDKDTCKILLLLTAARSISIGLPHAGIQGNIFGTGDGSIYWVNVKDATVGQSVRVDSYDYYDGLTVICAY